MILSLSAWKAFLNLRIVLVFSNGCGVLIAYSDVIGLSWLYPRLWKDMSFSSRFVYFADQWQLIPEFCYLLLEDETHLTRHDSTLRNISEYISKTKPSKLVVTRQFSFKNNFRMLLQPTLHLEQETNLGI